MKKTLGGAAVFVITAAVGGAAFAQTAPAPRPAGPAANAPVSQAAYVQRRIEPLRAADANHDGTVTIEEARAARAARDGGRRAAEFARMDADKDGMVSRAEYHAPRDGGVERAVVITEAEQKAREAFARMDADHDGALTAAERQAYSERRAARRAARPAPAASPSTPASE